jgi:hydroxyethylthiazole kinase
MRNPGTTAHNDMARNAAELVERLRAEKPRIHCITNAVAQNFTANVLLAVGAVPSMTLAPEEIADFVASAQGLLVNLGTLDRERRKAAERAVEAARRERLPWLLDPVYVDRVPQRLTFAKVLLARGPAAMRLNHAEFAALAGSQPTPCSVAALAQEHGIVLGLSGETDMVTDGDRYAAISNGHPLMAKVTAMGCAVSAVATACLAVEPDAWRATCAALMIAGVAGEMAGERASGPGSFAVAILDALHNLDGDALIARARIESQT